MGTPTLWVTWDHIQIAASSALQRRRPCTPAEVGDLSVSTQFLCTEGWVLPLIRVAIQGFNVLYFRGRKDDESSYLNSCPSSLCPLWPVLSLNKLFFSLLFSSTNISIYDDLAPSKDLMALSKPNTQIPERDLNYNISIFPSLKLGEIQISVFLTA